MTIVRMSSGNVLSSDSPALLEYDPDSGRVISHMLTDGWILKVVSADAGKVVVRQSDGLGRLALLIYEEGDYRDPVGHLIIDGSESSFAGTPEAWSLLPKVVALPPIRGISRVWAFAVLGDSLGRVQVFDTPRLDELTDSEGLLLVQEIEAQTFALATTRGGRAVVVVSADPSGAVSVLEIIELPEGVSSVASLTLVGDKLILDGTQHLLRVAIEDPLVESIDLLRSTEFMVGPHAISPNQAEVGVACYPSGRVVLLDTNSLQQLGTWEPATALRDLRIDGETVIGLAWNSREFLSGTFSSAAR